MNRVVDVDFAAFDCFAQTLEAFVKVLDDGFEKHLRILRQTQFPVEMVVLTLPVVSGDQQHAEAAKREAVLDRQNGFSTIVCSTMGMLRPSLTIWWRLNPGFS